MKLPPPPVLRKKQRTKNRFFETREMMDALSIYYGSRRAIYRRTWKYRTLILAHRMQHSQSMHRKGYGPDWKSLKKTELEDGKVVWQEDGGMSMKNEVLEYASEGTLPLVALQKASELLIAAEMQAVVAHRVAELLKKKRRRSRKG